MASGSVALTRSCMAWVSHDVADEVVTEAKEEVVTETPEEVK